MQIAIRRFFALGKAPKKSENARKAKHKASINFQWSFWSVYGDTDPLLRKFMLRVQFLI